MEWSITEVGRLTGTTSRTLRHYDAIGLLTPSRTADNGYRYYDEAALVRLQRILLLRALGLGLPAIGEALRSVSDVPAALSAHLDWLRHEQDRLARQARAVEDTMKRLKKGEPLMAENMFDGFDHTQYKDEVESRWGAKAYADSDAWWRGMSASEKADWLAKQKALGDDWLDAVRRGIPADGDEAQQLAARHAAWLSGIPGTPGSENGRPTAAYLTGLGEMYVADARFAANYGGEEGARFVRDALAVYAERHLA
ncbi:DNA-binding transcriptional regulator, MerR family [Paramicrobacterium humi]|uniref:DNA-binding transcriptional regulator, MerR family n=1 Tax=Paramicrobacterium humi TaxID=640635 RepID=A0A1H4MGC6_9MICO|nr:MerR family transcriptional regulator [Microbacterium humi]SEB81758.1 DNA-binding transcriptional regulator, MerR family [Microbacterium humi]